MTATIEVDLEELEGMAAAVPRAAEGLAFSHLLTGDCTSTLGCAAVASGLREVSRQLGRRADLVVDAVDRLAVLPREFVAGVRAVDSCLAGQVGR